MSSTGKIARLPDAIRTQLNHRLLDGEAAEPILAWLNADPGVRKILTDQFAGHPLTPQNLSEWRTGGFADWQLRREVFGQGRQLHESAGELQKDIPQGLAESLATVLTAYYAALLNPWDGEVTDAFNQKLRALSRLNRDLANFRKADLAIAKLQLQQAQFDARRKKTEAEQQEIFKQWLKRPEARKLAREMEQADEARHQHNLEVFRQGPSPHSSPPPIGRTQSDQIAPTTAVPPVVSVPLVSSVPSVPSVPSPDPESHQIAPPHPENPAPPDIDPAPASPASLTPSPLPSAQPIPTPTKPRKDPVAEALAEYHKKRYAAMEAEFARRPPARLIPLDPPECHHSRRILG